MNNVISINKDRPNDLMTFAEIKAKHGLKYDYLYKYTMIKKELTPYDKGGIAISEKELLSFLDKRSRKWQVS